MSASGKGYPKWIARLLVLAPPAVWLVLFVLLPFLIVLRISLSQTALAQPPYVPVLDLAAGFAGVRHFVAALSFDTYALLASDSLYLLSYARSLEIAALSTALLLLLGYPIAYAMARAPQRAQAVLVLAIVLPFLTAFLIRIYAWITILQREGLLNALLLRSGLIDEPLTLLSSDGAVILGIVYSYLPFMVLPLYASLQRLDDTLLEAAADLGCPRWKAFWTVTVPLSRPGIAAGVLLCFIPIAGEFVIPDLLGGSDTLMIGQTLWSEFFANRDWPVASALAVVLLLVLLAPIVWHQHLRAKAMEQDR